MEQAKKCIDTTLCYVQNDKNQYLMLHRVKKKNDYNHDKWIGIGGKLENGETPTQCVLREVQEETGLTLLDCVYRGVIHFTATQCPTECMHLFTATKFCGEQRVCDEGDLQWVNVCDLHKYPMWQGDKIFLRDRKSVV